MATETKDSGGIASDDWKEGVIEIEPAEHVEAKHKTEQSDRYERLRDNAQNPPEPDPNIFLDYVREYVNADDVLAWKQTGVQPGDFQNLQLGNYKPSKAIDLHHKTVFESRQLLWDFMQDAVREGCRVVVVVHGRGERSNPPAALKSYVFQCLQGHENVLALTTAPSGLGGKGATLVQLKKSEEERERTRELHGLKYG